MNTFLTVNPVTAAPFPRMPMEPTYGVRPTPSLEQRLPEGPAIPSFQRLSAYLGPYQAGTLFLAGLATSFGAKWFLQAVLHNPSKVAKPLSAPRGPSTNGLDILSRGANEVQDQVGMVFREGWTSALMFALKHPEDPMIQRRLLAYVGALVTGYVTGSFAQGAQEVWVRREETQIRATLLERLTQTFRQSLQTKTLLDHRLTQQAKARIGQILKQCRIPLPSNLTFTQDPSPVRMVTYPGEPVHFAKPQPFSGYTRFGNQTALSPVETSFSGLWAYKTACFVGGMAVGGLLQGVVALIQKQRHAPSLAPWNRIGAKKMVMGIYNVENLEALFLKGDKPLLWAFLGLTAAAKLGKILWDGYREVEVTRQHAGTELRYQTHNWLVLDPTYHRIAEEEALTDAITKFQQALPMEYTHPQALKDRIQTILTNIGRNSTPKYMPMTPYVNLVAARG